MTASKRNSSVAYERSGCPWAACTIRLIVGRRALDVLWIRSLVAIVCVLVLLTPEASAQVPGPLSREYVAQFPRDKTLVVKLKSGDTIKGKILSAGETSFEFQPQRGTIFKSPPKSVTLIYQDVRSIEPAGHKTLIITLVAVGGAFALLLGIMYATCGSGGCH